MIMSSNPETPSEDESPALALRVARGDRLAEDQVVQTYAARVMAMAMVRVRDREAARELVNDILMATIRALRQDAVHDTARLGAFIHGTALNLINNFLRSSKRRPEHEALKDDVPAINSAEILEQGCDLALLRRSIARLDAIDREVLTLTLDEGLEPEEIARQTGLTQEAVRQRKCRALQRLRHALNGGSRGGGPGPLR